MLGLTFEVSAVAVSPDIYCRPIMSGLSPSESVAVISVTIETGAASHLSPWTRHKFHSRFVTDFCGRAVTFLPLEQSLSRYDLELCHNICAGRVTKCLPGKSQKLRPSRHILEQIAYTATVLRPTQRQY